MIVHQIHFESVPVSNLKTNRQLRVTVRLHMLTSSPLSLCSRQPGIAPISATDTALSPELVDGAGGQGAGVVVLK